MKKCSEIKELISLYIDDELDIDESREFEEHMESCEECRNELYELKQIVGLCRDTAEEELPADFRMELHQKLLSIQNQTVNGKKVLLFRTKYFGLFSSVAAVFLLVFLIRGFFGFDLFPNTKSSDSAEKMDMMAEAPAQDSAQRKAASPDSADSDTNLSLAKSAETAQDYTIAGQGSQGGSHEIDRSTKDDRESQISLAAAEAGNERVSKNTTSITIAVDDPESQIENVKAIALKNSGVEQTAALSDETEPGQTEEKGTVSLFFNIPNMQLSAFINTLNTDYSQSSVQPGTVIAEDMYLTLEDLLEQSDTLDTEIEKTRNTAGTKQEDLEKMNTLKVEIQDKIDSIRLGTDITIVEVILKNK